MNVRNLFFSSFLFLSSLHASCDWETFARMDVRHRAPEGVGVEEGYTTGELFLAAALDNRWMGFLDTRGHIFNDGRVAANAGVGTRCCQGDWVFGGNFFYDFRAMPKNLRDEFDFSFQQIGAGLELLGSVDFRVNGYLPINQKFSTNKGAFYQFQGNNALAQQEGVAAFASIDAEIGAPVGCVFDTLSFYLAAGPYYLFERSFDSFQLQDALGGRVRIEASLWNYLSFEASVTHDRNFKTRVQGAIQFTCPLGGSSNTGCRRLVQDSCGRCASRCVSPVKRQEIIPIDRKKREFSIINCQTNQPYNILFVDNSNTGTGEGTFENPYTQLSSATASAQEQDILYLYPGDETTKFQDSGIVLKEGQRLVGSGVPLTLGSFTAPAATPGLYPHITNTALNSTVITLANSNEVAGIFIDGGSIGIQNLTSDGSCYSIHDNVVRGMQKEALNLTLQEQSCAFVYRNDLESTQSIALSGGLNGGSFLHLFANSFKVGDSMDAIGLSINESKVFLENNLLSGPFQMRVSGSSPSTLSATGNAPLSLNLDPTYKLLNDEGDPSLFQVEVPNPSNGQTSFETVNQGTLSIEAGGVTYVPLGTEIAEDATCPCPCKQ